MKATWLGKTVAGSEDIVEAGGYAYFPREAVRLDWLEKSPKTADDKVCPHGVQFYDLTVDGVRAERSAWSYEKPGPSLRVVGGRFGFWDRVEVS